ncbi:MAG TPA: hypothetical protein DC049_09380, partial [Spirochaetia bacterium]|nr:hypothetical protein [Spirochaetia bacterium]
MDKLPAQPNQSLIDGMSVLQALSSSGEVSCSQIAALLGLEITRVNRLLKTLAWLGFAHRLPSRTYSPGPGMHVLSAQSMFGSGLIKKAMGPLKKLHKLKLICAMGMLWRDQVCYLYHRGPGMKAEEALGRIGLYPAIHSSIGMALLAEKAEDEIRILFKNKTPERFSDIDKLLSELKKIKSRGYGEVLSKARSIAVTIGNPAYAGIALSGNIGDKKIEQICTVLKQVKNEIEKKDNILQGVFMINMNTRNNEKKLTTKNTKLT